MGKQQPFRNYYISQIPIDIDCPEWFRRRKFGIHLKRTILGNTKGPEHT